MKWLKRIFFSTSEHRLEEAFKRIEQLETEQKLFRAGMTNLQTALIAISSNQEGVANDVHRIQEAIQEIAEGIQYQLLHGSSDDGHWH